jgi:hypothetical protein
MADGSIPKHEKIGMKNFTSLKQKEKMTSEAYWEA